MTHLTLPAGAKTSPLPFLPLTPQQAAGQALTEAARTTAIRVDSNVTVAGEAAYQLVLAPKSPGSLIGQVRIAIDARRHVPLRVQVFARGAASPAFQIGFTSHLVRHAGRGELRVPARPPGAAVVQEQHRVAGQAAGQALGGDVATGSGVIGNGWLAVADLPESALSSLAGGGPPGEPGGPACWAVRPFERIGWPGARRPGRGGARHRHRRDLQRRAATSASTSAAPGAAGGCCGHP